MKVKIEWNSTTTPADFNDGEIGAQILIWLSTLNAMRIYTQI